MTEQINSLKTALRNKRADLMNLLHSQSAQLTISEGEPDLTDRIQSMCRRDEAVTLLNTLTRTLTTVDAALMAMQEGSYGVCADCGEPIATRRLQAIPWASYCIRCQEKLDRRNHLRAATPYWDEAA